jgi:hypothetical protein
VHHGSKGIVTHAGGMGGQQPVCVDFVTSPHPPAPPPDFAAVRLGGGGRATWHAHMAAQSASSWMCVVDEIVSLHGRPHREFFTLPPLKRTCSWLASRSRQERVMSDEQMLYDVDTNDGWFNQTRTRSEQQEAMRAFIQMEAALNQCKDGMARLAMVHARVVELLGERAVPKSLTTRVVQIDPAALGRSHAAWRRWLTLGRNNGSQNEWGDGGKASMTLAAHSRGSVRRH